jgi:acylphosphatase
VGFRVFVLREARRLRLSGWVVNRPDGAVELEVEGPQADLLALQNLLRKGPSGARVEQVETRSVPTLGARGGFEIR